jgi:hypothetical protein
MSDRPADFAVFGTSPLARLLAGLLASEHGRRVVFVGESQAAYRLPRGVDLSVAPVTRPETWAMLGEGVAESVRLIGRIAGRGAWSYADPILFASDARGREALSHVRHMAQGFRIAAEPAPPSLIGASRSGIRVRDAVRINRPTLETALDRWLDRSGVQRIATGGVVIATDGSARIAAQGREIEAAQSVLVDAEAIMAWLPLRQWPPLLRREAQASILTTPRAPLAANTMLDVSSGTTLLQQPDGGIAAVGPGDLARFSRTLQALLGSDRQLELAGQTGFTALVTADGAPAFGRAAGVGADIVAGTGMIGAFLAPALARWLAGTAPPHQASWFGNRLVNRGARSASVADFMPARLEAAA